MYTIMPATMPNMIPYARLQNIRTGTESVCSTYSIHKEIAAWIVVIG